MKDKDREAFEALVEHKYRQLLRSAYLLTGDWGLAEDLLQTALAKTWFRWRSLRDPAAAGAYVRKVMVNLYTKGSRRRWREVPSELPEQPAPDAFARVDDRDRLERALATLRPRTRAALVLRYFDDMTEAQAAEALGVPLGTLKSLVHRGLARLRELDVLATAVDRSAPPAPRTFTAEASPS